MGEEGLLWDVRLCQAGPSSALVSQKSSLSTGTAFVLLWRHGSPFQASLCRLQRKKEVRMYLHVYEYFQASPNQREGRGAWRHSLRLGNKGNSHRQEFQHPVSTPRTACAFYSKWPLQKMKLPVMLPITVSSICFCWFTGIWLMCFKIALREQNPRGIGAQYLLNRNLWPASHDGLLALQISFKTVLKLLIAVFIHGTDVEISKTSHSNILFSFACSSSCLQG